MKIFRTVTWLMVAILAGYLGWNLLGDKPMEQAVKQVASVGGPFELERTDGSKITYEDLKGKPHILFFGFTHCPEICPTTLFETSGWLSALGEDADRLGVYFITVDPERDTKEVSG